MAKGKGSKKVTLVTKIKADIDAALKRGYYSTRSFGSWNLFKKAKQLENAEFNTIMQSFQDYLGKDYIVYSNRQGVFFAYAKDIKHFSQYVVTTAYALKDENKRTPTPKAASGIEYIL